MILATPFASVAVAAPVTLVVVGCEHSTIRLVGMVSAGGVVSRTIIVCVQLALLPQASVAVQRRAMVLVLPQLLVVKSVKVMTGVLPASVAVATPVTLVVVTAGYSRITSGTQAMTGAVVSRTVMSWVLLVELPHSSVARQM